MNKGYLNIISGPSGAGKSTLIKRFLNQHKGYIFPTSITTRPPREGEINGDHYLFVDEKEFIKRKDNDEFLEWANVYGMFYGTLKSTILNGLKEGKKFIKDIDVQGASVLMDLLNKNDYMSIFISPPSIEVLKKRLIDRGSENEQQLSERLKFAQKEIDKSNMFDVVINNDNLENAYKKFSDIMLKH